MANPYFEVPYHPVRAVLLSRVTYLLLAGDLWFGMIQHGGRYGLGDFNVSHFAVLDALLPVPSAGFYVGLLLFSGFISLTLALFDQPRWLRVLLACSYSLAWMVSIHDSYQHHYFLSWLLAWCAALPTSRWSDLKQSEGDRVSGWGLPMVCMTCTIVYGFTGIAKSESAWRRGDVLRALARGGSHTDWGVLTPVHDLLHQIGVSDSALWTVFAYATIALQWTIALGYACAPSMDGDPSRWRRWTVLLGLVGALCFHASAELFGSFEIGLFSYYMIGTALVLLSPVSWLLPVARLLSHGVERVQRWSAPVAEPESWLRFSLVVCSLPAIGLLTPLPGVFVATCGLAAIVSLRLYLAQRTDRSHASAIALQTAFCCLTLWLSLTQSTIAFDFYRRTAGELRRMGRTEEALATYRLANLHARWGHSREHEVRDLERKLHTQHEH